MQTELLALRNDLEEVNATLEHLLQTKELEHVHLYEAARYAVLGPGKRIRPLLCLAATQLFGIPNSHALVPASALELIHCYSLIHDDLPAMDNDDYRRGRPTLHKVYPEGHAILTGDYLLTYAFELLSNAPHLSAEKRINLVRILAEAAGGEGMVGGQVRDVSSEGKNLKLNDLEELHLRKTGRMFQAALLFGAVISDANETNYQLLKEIGEKIGLAFQIHDDVIDVINSAQKHGYSVSSDQTNNKTTYVTLLGLDEARTAVDTLLQETKTLFEKLPANQEKLKTILHRAFSIK
ncbi:MAG: polyprenyl synthetase family protein [Parachlamydiales bacterium]|jgi:geranylgeranyl diphosphate synthase type II